MDPRLTTWNLTVLSTVLYVITGGSDEIKVNDLRLDNIVIVILTRRIMRTSEKHGRRIQEHFGWQSQKCLTASRRHSDNAINRLKSNSGEMMGTKWAMSSGCTAWTKMIKLSRVVFNKMNSAPKIGSCSTPFIKNRLLYLALPL